MTKLDALFEAKKMARSNGKGYAYAVETIHGWVAAPNKPMLRAGKVIECRETGGEYPA